MTSSPKRTGSKGYLPCRCCGKPVPVWLGTTRDKKTICTKCIPKHWGKHVHGVNASRCKEFGQKSRLTRHRSEIDSRRAKR